MMECFILPNGTEKSRLSAVVIFSITTIDILHNHDSRDIPVPTDGELGIAIRSGLENPDYRL